MKLCANILGRNIIRAYVRSKFSCVRSSHGFCVRAHSLEGTFSMTSSVKFSRAYMYVCRRMYQIGTSEEQECYTLLNFIIQLDLISSFHDSVASPGNDVRGAQYEVSSPPVPVSFSALLARWTKM